MLTKTTKICKISKMQNFEKKYLEIWRKGTFPPNLALICLTGSEKTGFTDERQTDGRILRTSDACVTTAALLCSSTKQS